MLAFPVWFFFATERSLCFWFSHHFYSKMSLGVLLRPHVSDHELGFGPRVSVCGFEAATQAKQEAEQLQRE
jgi:hypothetical protein